MKKIVLTLILFLSSLSSVAQIANVTGRVQEANGSPLEFVNVVLLSLPDSTFVGGVTSDETGKFSIKLNKPYSTLILKTSYLGYSNSFKKITANDAGAIVMSEADQMLEAIVVKGTRNHFKMENGGISADIANSPLKNIGTANEVLEKLPFVVKEGDAFTVLGKGKPLIYINSRLVRNENELERLSSGNIKKVTVITNPGPEYDATVSAVIRIEAVRPPGEGVGGEVFGRIKAARQLSADGSIDLNYRKNKFDVFAYYGYTDRKQKVKTTINQSL